MKRLAIVVLMAGMLGAVPATQPLSDAERIENLEYDVKVLNAELASLNKALADAGYITVKVSDAPPRDFSPLMSEQERQIMTPRSATRPSIFGAKGDTPAKVSPTTKPAAPPSRERYLIQGGVLTRQN